MVTYSTVYFILVGEGGGGRKVKLNEREFTFPGELHFTSFHGSHWENEGKNDF